MWRNGLSAVTRLAHYLNKSNFKQIKSPGCGDRGFVSEMSTINTTTQCELIVAVSADSAQLCSVIFWAEK